MPNNLAVLFCALLLVLVLGQTGEDDLVDISQISMFPQNYTHKVYSGYLTISPLGNKDLHYFFYESQHDPDSDPLLLWLNGGPGCSSMLGMLYENGPLMFKPNSTEMFINPFAWNLRANVLYLESPAGVGFSIGQNKSDLIANDTTTARDNLLAMRLFFLKFPGMKKNDFYITGESYAGIYIPTLAKAILDFNEQADVQRINLKGISVGNGCTHPTECGNDYYSYYQVQYAHQRGFITDESFKQFRDYCLLAWKSPGCIAQQKRVAADFIATGADIYNIYGPCYNQTYPPKMHLWEQNLMNKPGLKHTLRCSDSIGSLLLFNLNENRAPLHIKQENDTLQWTTCSDTLDYTINPEGSYYLYNGLIKAGLKVLVYSGDADAMVPITGTKFWLREFMEEYKRPVKRPWRPWVTHNQNVSGMVWEIEGLTFASIRGAGHMVPTDKPEQALNMLQTFINDAQFISPSDYEQLSMTSSDSEL